MSSPNPQAPDPRMVEWLRTPSGFAQGVLGMKLYATQARVMDALLPLRSAVSFKSCNEGGKTKRVICGVVLWHLAQFPYGHVVTTSGSYRQIKDQLLPALHGYSARFPAWEFHRTPRIDTQIPDCFWDGFSTSEGGKFEGHHAGSEAAAKRYGAAYDPHAHAPLLVIVDEAKTVKDDIFEAVERCKATRLLICSSPGYAEGEFYRSHTTRAKFYQTFSQKATDCPHITAEEIQRTRDKWGPDHPLVRSMIDADFMAFVEDAVINLRSVEDLLANPPRHEPTGERKAFCDFAWSGAGDENVLALREGNRVTLPLTFHAGDLHAVCGRFVAEFKRLSLRPEDIEGDSAGGGSLVCDQLDAMGWPIVRSNNAGAPRWEDNYANLGAETWFEGALAIERREVILPDDNDLRGQLLDRKKAKHARGKLAIESKADMRNRGVPSPDRADAVLGAMTPKTQQSSISMGRPAQSIEDMLADTRSEESASLLEAAGMFVG